MTAKHSDDALATIMAPQDTHGDPENLDVEALTRLRLLLGRFGRVLRQQLPQGDLAYPQVSLLLSIEKAGTATAGELAVAEGVSPPSVTRSLKLLAGDGLVSRVRDSGDGRISRVSLSAKGRVECDWIRQRRDALLLDRVARLRPEDRAILVRAIPVFERLLDAGEAVGPHHGDEQDRL